jgi:hypothetical protein
MFDVPWYFLIFYLTSSWLRHINECFIRTKLASSPAYVSIYFIGHLYRLAPFGFGHSFYLRYFPAPRFFPLLHRTPYTTFPRPVFFGHVIIPSQEAKCEEQLPKVNTRFSLVKTQGVNTIPFSRYLASSE